jgi:tetratricopeptide (TPR) repeat protein
MPSHIYVLLGMYDQAAACNVEAITADEKYVLKEGIYNCYTGYRIHNIHFVSYAAMFAGQFDIAIDAAKQVKKNLPDDLMSNPFMAKYFEAFLSIEWHVLVRFGQWEEILSRPVPIDASNPPTDYVYPYTLAMQHYARGIAHAVLTGQKEDSSLIAAEKELALFRDAALIVPADRVMHNNLCSELIRVGDAMLQGEIKYRGKCFDDAFALLRQAVEISDSLVYDEPWGW